MRILNNSNSIYYSTKRVKEFSIQTITAASIPMNYEKHVLVSNRVRATKLGFERNKRLRPNFKWDLGGTNAKNTKPIQSTSKYHDEEISEEDTIVRKIRSNPYKKVSDNLVVRIITKLSKIIAYLMANKGEAVFYGIGLMLIFLFFSSILQR